MDSLYFRSLGTYQNYGMYGAMSIGASMMPTQIAPQISMQAGLMLSINAGLGLGWGGYIGGLSGMAGMYGQMGLYGGLMGAGIMMPGPQAMGMLGMAGMGAIGVMDNTIEVAGSGMGQDKKYKMFPGELMAVYSLLKNGQNVSPEDMKKQLEEKYGIQAEIKDIDGQKALVNTATGNVLISDSNGNSIMDKGDMKFDDALKLIKEKYGIDQEMFEKMYAKDQGGVGATTGWNVPMAGGVAGMGGIGAVNMYPWGFPGMGSYYPFGMGAMGGFGIWGDPMWQNTIFGIFAGAMKYAGMTMY